MDGFRFSTDLRVRFSEIDAQGIVHNAAYLVWLEIARIDYLARFAGGYKGVVQEHGIYVTTVEAYVRYRQPTRFDDQWGFGRARATCAGRASASSTPIERTMKACIVADGWTAHAGVDAGPLRRRRLPEWLVETAPGSRELATHGHKPS